MIWIIFIAVMILSMIVQNTLQSRFRKYSKVLLTNLKDLKMTLKKLQQALNAVYPLLNSTTFKSAILFRFQRQKKSKEQVCKERNK